MPVKFKGESEYKDNYPEFQSYKSASFEPSPEQAASSAGLNTMKKALVTEPPLQRRRKVTGPPVSLSTEFYDQSLAQPVGDFALLGQNEKFASNVQYRPKSGNINNNNRAMSPPKQLRMELKRDQIIDKARPAPVVNTQKFVETPMPATPLAPRRESGQAAQKTKMVQTQQKNKSVLQKTSDKPVRELPPKQAAVKSLTKENEAPVKQALKDKNLSDVLGELKKKKPSMNEFTQANMEKGVVDSAPEAPAEYAMKYKAGVAPARPSRKQSEYQREFEWKNRIGSSPMLAAEQVVYNSKVGPVKTSGFPKTSEYKAQFKKWKAVENEPVPAVKRAVQQMAATRQKALKRSKSVGAVEGRDAVRRGPSIERDRQPGQEEEEEAKAEVPKAQPHHGKLRRVVTEYAANFKNPQKFNYDKGGWKGADPPHMYAQKPEVDSGEPPLKSWFAEVLELRRKADEYKKRAQGTHFSREHLVQLLAKQAGFWDIPTARSSSSSTLSALSLEAGNLVHKTKKQLKTRKESEKNLVDFESCKATIADSETPSEPDDGLFEERPAAVGKKNRKMAWGAENMEQDQLEEDAAESVISPSASSGTAQGRIPTPQWRQTGKTPKKTRHHLDRTTPAVGGAILTSPPHPVIQSRSSRSEGSSQDTWEEESERKQFGKTYNLNRLLTTPTFGQPSHDTHALRDDAASMDQPLRTTYVFTPGEDLADLEQEVVLEEPVPAAPARRQSRRKERMRPAGIPSTLHEEMGQTYTKPILNLPPDSEPAEDNDDNVSLSLSVRSIASSCSMVSDIYERSKNRRDNFWTKGGIATR